MNTATWIIQGILAAAFFMAGYMKSTTSIEKLNEKMSWTKDSSSGLIRFIGLSELFAALGLILPMALNILPILTAIAAAALVIVMILAIATHMRRKEYKEVGMNVVLGGLALFVTIVRF